MYSPKRNDIVNILFIALQVSEIRDAIATFRESKWKVMTGQKVTSASVVTPARSRLHCAILCAKTGLCTVSAYDAVTGLCHLHPTFSGSGTDTVFEQEETSTAPPCQANCDVAAAANACITTNNSPTSWEGDVSCQEDYVYSADDQPTARCQETGQWTVTMNGKCKQRVWRNRAISTEEWFFLPRTPQVGWTFCLTGVPNTPSVFGIDFQDNTGKIPYHFSMRLNYGEVNRTILSHLHAGGWGPQLELVHPNPPFPFVYGHPFSLNVTFTGSNEFKMYTNGYLYATKTNCPMGVSTVYRIKIFNPVNITYVNVWCL